MKNIITVLFILLVTYNVSAQVQQGFVKTIGRPGKPGIPLKDVTIQMVGMVNATISSETGEFHLSANNKKDGDAIRLLRIQKKGYELTDKDIIGRDLVFSSRVPIYITMVDSLQLEADKKRIEDKARSIAEKNFQEELEKIEIENTRHNLSAERYRKEIYNLQNKYENYLSLIGDMADRYARTDYDLLDSLDIVINNCIENCELEKADSLIRTVFNPKTVVERNRSAKKEIENRIKFAQAVIDKATAEKKEILKDFEYSLQIAVLSENLASEHIAHDEINKAIDCLKMSLSIKRTLYGDNSHETIKLVRQIEELEK